MGDIVTSIFLLFGGVGALMLGMKMMSEGLERSAGKGVRKLLNKISNNRFAGVAVGSTVTAIIQSSAATTVMVIGFVNAGMMTLFQATAIIMGANIGTTVTGLIASLSALPVQYIFMMFALVGVLISMFTKSDRVKRIGELLTGFGILFVGLNLASNAFKNETINTTMTSVFSTVSFPLLLILIGFAFTALIQSSSAVTSIVITMVGAAAMPLSSALFVVLGTNIGTCVTAAIASIGASTNAKRTAAIHLLFNVIGTAVFTSIIWPLQGQVVGLFNMMAISDEFKVAIFHLVFNITTTALLIPFIRPLTKITEIIIPNKATNEEDLRLYYIDDRFLQTPPIAVAQTTREVQNMATLVRENLVRGISALTSDELPDKTVLYRTENKINFINKGITAYLIKLSALPIAKSDEKYVGGLFHVVNDLERIGDHAENFFEDGVAMRDNDSSFSARARGDIANMTEKVLEMFDKAVEVFTTRDITQLSAISAMEDKVDALNRLLAYEHVQRLNDGECTVENSVYFNSTISALERIGDHLTNIAFSVKSPSGSQRDALERIAREHKQAAPVIQDDGATVIQKKSWLSMIFEKITKKKTTEVEDPNGKDYVKNKAVSPSVSDIESPQVESAKTQTPQAETKEKREETSETDNSGGER